MENRRMIGGLLCNGWSMNWHSFRQWLSADHRKAVIWTYAICLGILYLLCPSLLSMHYDYQMTSLVALWLHSSKYLRMMYGFGGSVDSPMSSWVWNAKAEKIQDIENHTQTTVLNQENNMFNPRLLYITARNSIHVQDVVNTCVKMEIYMQE